VILIWSHSSILMCYWFACKIWSMTEWTSLKNINSPSAINTELLLAFYKSNVVLLMSYWFSWYLIPAYRCVIDSHVTSFQHTNVLLILMVPHSSILIICYWFSYYFIPAYWCGIDSHVTLFQHTDVSLILMCPHSSILM
jgi:hypothetical protein